MMRVVAQRDDRYFLLSEDTNPETAKAHVFDRLWHVRFPDMLATSILAQSYWRPPTVADQATVISEDQAARQL